MDSSIERKIIKKIAWPVICCSICVISFIAICNLENRLAQSDHANKMKDLINEYNKAALKKQDSVIKIIYQK